MNEGDGDGGGGHDGLRGEAARHSADSLLVLGWFRRSEQILPD